VARILVASLAAHAVLLLALALRSQGPEAAPDGEGAVRGALLPYEPPATAGTEFGWRLSVVEPPALSAFPDDLLLRGQETITPMDLEGLAEPEPMPGRSFEHPAEVTVAMARRRQDFLKRRTLALLGFDADGTMRAVGRGLSWLAGEQQGDGAFAAPGDRDRLLRTSLALLPFLGEAYCSASPDDQRFGRVVQRGIARLRADTFEEDGRLRVDGTETESLGCLATALSEDYMLSFGRLTVAEAASRRVELTTLHARLAAEGERAGPWAHLGGDAVRRSGVLGISTEEDARFRAWTHRMASLAPGEDPWQVFLKGASLLRQERGASKPRFLAWSEEHAEALVARLLPDGRARGDDPLRDTAAVLLALQAAYRSY
jgi:hypothetical protein